MDQAALTDPAVTNNMSAMPGNAEAGTWLPDFLNPAKSSLIGKAWTQTSGIWDSWVGAVKSYTVDPLVNLESSAASVVSGAGSSAYNFVKSAESSAVSYASGLVSPITTGLSSAGSMLKLALFAIIGLAVLYVLMTFGGLLPKKWRLKGT